MAPFIARLQHAGLLLTPFAVGLVLLVLSLLPVGLTGGLIVTPALALMPVYFWTLYSPQLMPPLAVFSLGLAQDLVSGGPLGLWAFAFLAAFGVLSSQRLFLVSLLQGRLGLGFAFIAAVASAFAWAAGSLVFGRVLDPGPVVLQALLSIVLYPVIGRVLVVLHMRVQRELS